SSRPHARQNRATSGFSWPQAGQRITRPSVVVSQAEAKAAGQAEIFGIEKRAIVPNCGAGLHACATPASQATERKTNASSIEKPCSSTSSFAASSETSFSASSNSSAVAGGSQGAGGAAPGAGGC